MMNKRWLGMAAAVILLAVILAAMILGCGDGVRDASVEDKSATLWERSENLEPGPEKSFEAEEMGGDEAYMTLETATPTGDISTGEVSTLPQAQLRVVKNALMKMEVAKGEYAKIRNDAVFAASSVGGYVENESSSQDDEGYTYASLTLRIPAEHFDEMMSEVSELGEVVSTNISTSDVSSEYVDLESRLKHLEAEEAFYMALIDKAQTIEEMISIREHLSYIQLEKEQIQGRKNFLDQKIELSTITLSVDELSPEEEGEGFWHSVGEAFKCFGRGMCSLAIGLFYALPYIIILAIIILVVWLLVRRSRRGGKAADGEEHPQQ